MVSLHETKISKAPIGSKLIVTRNFDAPVAKVWRAWTDRHLLDEWWAPRPWKAETKSFSLSTGGRWLYAMVGPTGEKHWCAADFKAIVPEKQLSVVSVFCDEEGNTNPATPPMYWNTQFRTEGGGTAIHVEISFNNDADLETIVGMGFKEGFTMGLGNLDELLAGQ